METGNSEKQAVEDKLSFPIPLLATYFHVFLHSSAGTIDLSAVYRWTDFGDVLFTAVIRPFVTLEDKANARRIVVRFLTLNYSKLTKRGLYCHFQTMLVKISPTTFTRYKKTRMVGTQICV